MENQVHRILVKSCDGCPFLKWEQDEPTCGHPQPAKDKGVGGSFWGNDSRRLPPMDCPLRAKQTVVQFESDEMIQQFVEGDGD